MTSPNLFDIILDVMMWGFKEQPHWCILFADDIVLCSTRREHAERKLDEWRRAMEKRGLKISRKKTEYLGCDEHQDAEIHSLTGRGNKEIEDIHIPGIYVGGGWITGCGSHPQSAELVEELEECLECCATGE